VKGRGHGNAFRCLGAAGSRGVAGPLKH
jgi:hypothetical protein